MKHLTIGISGNLGSGKTLGMSILGHYGYLEGNNVSANYIIKGYPNTLLTQGMQLKDVHTDRNLYLMDELWIDIDSRRSGGNVSLSQKFLQMRKRDISLIYTSQSLDQVEKRVRQITNLLFFPKTVCDNNDYPIYVVFHYTTSKNLQFDSELINHLPSFALPVNINGYDVAQNYDTTEIVEGLEDEENDLISTLTATYSGWDGTKTELESILVIEHNVIKSRAGMIATYIISKNKSY